MVSQELDNVIQSYDTNDGGYAHDSYQHEEKRNGTASPKSDDQFKAKRKRKRDLPNGTTMQMIGIYAIASC